MKLHPEQRVNVLLSHPLATSTGPGTIERRLSPELYQVKLDSGRTTFASDEHLEKIEDPVPGSPSGTESEGSVT